LTYKSFCDDDAEPRFALVESVGVGVPAGLDVRSGGKYPAPHFLDGLDQAQPPPATSVTVVGVDIG